MQIKDKLNYDEHKGSVYENMEMSGGDVKVDGGSVNIAKALSGTIRNLEVTCQGSLYAGMYDMKRTGHCRTPKNGGIER